MLVNSFLHFQIFNIILSAKSSAPLEKVMEFWSRNNTGILNLIYISYYFCLLLKSMGILTCRCAFMHAQHTKMNAGTSHSHVRPLPAELEIWWNFIVEIISFSKAYCEKTGSASYFRSVEMPIRQITTVPSPWAVMKKASVAP